MIPPGGPGSAGRRKARKVACLTVEYFFYCRGRPGTEALLEELAEAHWSFMDGYAEAMIARGPTLTPDRTTWTGSMHHGGPARCPGRAGVRLP